MDTVTQAEECAAWQVGSSGMCVLDRCSWLIGTSCSVQPAVLR